MGVELVQDTGTRVLVDAVQCLAMARSVLEIQEVVRAAARRMVDADGATFVLRDGDLCHYVDEDAIAPLWKGLRFPMETCISGWAMEHRAAVGIPDITVDRRIPQEAYAPTFVSSLAMVPIRSLDPIGAIGTYWAQPHPPTGEELQLLSALADSTAVAMENVRVFEELEQRVSERTAAIQTLHAEVTEQAERHRAAADRNEVLLRTLAHEVRGPLAAADGMLELVLDPDIGSDTVADVTLARECVQEGMRIVTEQLDLVRLDAGAVRVRPTDVDLPTLLHGLHGACRVLLRSDAVSLVLEPTSIASLRTDGLLLTQLLRNLLTNAAKFTDRGEIRLAATASRDRPGVAFTVVDTGIGIDPEDLPTVFADFGRVESGAAADRPGTGLGLPLVRRLAEALGGTVDVASTPGEGTTFTVWLPPLPAVEPGAELPLVVPPAA